MSYLRTSAWCGGSSKGHWGTYGTGNGRAPWYKGGEWKRTVVQGRGMEEHTGEENISEPDARSKRNELCPNSILRLASLES